MTEIQPIDFEQSEDWLDGPLPVSPTVPSGWTGLEKIMPALITRFNVGRKSALEFGVEYGYSTAVLAQLFDEVTGVDHFIGDEHSTVRDSYYKQTKQNLAPWPNIRLVYTDYRAYIDVASGVHDLIHVDIVHTYEATYEAGRWAADHAPVVIFHDTEYIWPEVKQAILQIAEETGRAFYNYPHCFGLGILA
jgi:hypothetical protein